MDDTTQHNRAGRDGAQRAFATRPIGVFDSGVGGLTVVRAIARRLPHESILYLGDTLRCPYGPRPLDEIRAFARHISAWLVAQGVKLIVIACNSATAAGLTTVQREAPVPVIGVIEPGAHAAVQATLSRRVGVIGTTATIDSDVYNQAIRSLDAGITTFSTATPRFVEMVEQGLRLGRGPIEDAMAQTSAIYLRPAFQQIARDYLDPLRRCDIDTLVLGCTHYPLLTPLISQIMGSGVQLISSAEETAHDVAQALGRRGQLAPDTGVPRYRFATTAKDVTDFARLGSAILAHPVEAPWQVTTTELEEALAIFEEDGKEREGYGAAN
ncbi:MAG: glutamate racemase [Coriobacteriales bacterium]|nr:glutamate racemase [Coriobacteriales bacterium]